SWYPGFSFFIFEGWPDLPNHAAQRGLPSYSTQWVTRTLLSFSGGALCARAMIALPGLYIQTNDHVPLTVLLITGSVCYRSRRALSGNSRVKKGDFRTLWFLDDRIDNFVHDRFATVLEPEADNDRDGSAKAKPDAPCDRGDEGVDDGEVKHQLREGKDGDDEIQEHPDQEQDRRDEVDILACIIPGKEINEIIRENEADQKNDDECDDVGDILDNRCHQLA